MRLLQSFAWNALVRAATTLDALAPSTPFSDSHLGSRLGYQRKRTRRYTFLRAHLPVRSMATYWLSDGHELVWFRGVFHHGQCDDG